jgi:hypothetical protein
VGPSKGANVTQPRLSIYADIDGDGSRDRVLLCSEALPDYVWA